MSPPKTFLERLIDRLDRLDRHEVGDYLISLARDKGLLESIFNSMQEGVVVVDPQARVVFINHAAARLLGLPPDSVGLPVAEVIADPALFEIIHQGLELTEQSLVRDFSVAHPSARWIRLSRSSLKDADGNPRGVLLILSDITRQRRAEAEVNFSERLDILTGLTAAVAHELGNPLSSLAIHVQLLERAVKELKPAGKKRLGASLQVVKEEISRLDGIIEQFLKMLRPEAFTLTEVEVRSVVREVVELVAEELRRKKIKIIKECPSEPVIARLDRNAIKQVLLNLVKNSAQAMPQGGEIRIGVRKKNSYLALSIADQGTGIPSQEIPRMFEPFFTTKKSGLGLGLLIVYKIVRLHAGSVEVVSQPGEGTVFTIWLPQRPGEIKLLPPPSRLSEAPENPEFVNH